MLDREILAKLLSREDIKKSLKITKPEGIISAEYYHELIVNVLIKEDGLTLQFNTDGARVFKTLHASQMNSMSQYLSHAHHLGRMMSFEHTSTIHQY